MHYLLRNLKLQLVLLFVFALYLPCVVAVPAYRGQISYRQPDGSILSIILHGDEFFNFRTTSDGYLLANGEDGYLYYGKFDDNGTIKSLNRKANNKEKRTASEKSFVSTLETIDPANSIRKFYSSTKATKFSSPGNDGIQKVFPTSGNGKSLVILVNFSDKSFVTANPKDAFTNLLNQEGYSENGGTGSARDYFRESSR